MGQPTMLTQAQILLALGHMHGWLLLKQENINYGTFS